MFQYGNRFVSILTGPAKKMNFKQEVTTGNIGHVTWLKSSVWRTFIPLDNLLSTSLQSFPV